MLDEHELGQENVVRGTWYVFDERELGQGNMVRAQ